MHSRPDPWKALLDLKSAYADEAKRDNVAVLAKGEIKFCLKL